MHEKRDKNKKVTLAIIIQVLLTFSHITYSQELIADDSLINVSKGSVILIKNIRSFVTSDTVIGIRKGLSRIESKNSDPAVSIYDSLKSRAAKTAVTRALFDLVIVSPRSSTGTSITEQSNLDFSAYEGKRIRTVQVKRLNVFGADISNPGFYTPKTLEKILNSTHINTTEKNIRKNLIFSEGDTVNSLKLSDNERLLRQLPYIDDARIIVVPVSDTEADIIVVTKDVYSIGADFSYKGKGKGIGYIFDRNIFGMGHEFRIEVPYSSDSKNSPGIGLSYLVNNISKSFVNLDINYYNALEKKSYGIEVYRDLISSETKNAGGITVNQTFTETEIDTIQTPAPLKYNYQEYWYLRSFLIDRESVSRIIAGVRYVNNNIFKKPEIDPDSYYSLQRFRLYLGSLTWSVQKFYKTNLIYSYGRTEDIPYGGMIRFTGGIENNEFKNRSYFSLDGSAGTSFKSLGYINIYSGIGAFFNGGETEQGLFSSRLTYFSNLYHAGSLKIRSFVNLGYTRGFDRYSDEYLSVSKENGFSGFTNDSLKGAQRVKLGIETVVFNPVNFYGFRFAFFGFADAAFLAGTNQYISNGSFLSSIGIGLRIRNDNLIFKTFQVRLGYFPSPPSYSSISNITVSGEQLLKPPRFEPCKPDLLLYR